MFLGFVEYTRMVIGELIFLKTSTDGNALLTTAGTTAADATLKVTSLLANAVRTHDQLLRRLT